jgi:hypothetical protein
MHPTMARIPLLAGLLLVAGACTALHEPLEEIKPQESIRLSGTFEPVGHCIEQGLRARDPNGHYVFVTGDVEGRIDGNGEWEIVLRQETPTSFRAAIKTSLTNTGVPKRPAGLTLMIAQCAEG